MKNALLFVSVLALGILMSCGSDEGGDGDSVTITGEATATLVYKELQENLSVTTLGTYSFSAEEFFGTSGDNAAFVFRQGTSGDSDYIRFTFDLTSVPLTSLTTQTYNFNNTDVMFSRLEAEFLSDVGSFFVDAAEGSDSLGEFSLTITSIDSQTQRISGTFTAVYVKNFSDRFIEVTGSFSDIPLLP